MGDKTAISWTDATWNPIRGCSKVSEGCRNCYAMGVAARFSGPGQPYEGLAKKVNGKPAWTGEVRFIDKHLADPLRWAKPRRVFVNSMSDLFHEGLTDSDIARVFGVMIAARKHQFQVLTKRPERMARLLASDRFRAHAERLASEHTHLMPTWPLPNVWLGTSVENQAAADERIPYLLNTPAAVRFLSCEPLLGPVTINNHFLYEPQITERGIIAVSRNVLHWVIDGGESGPYYRPANSAWYRALRDQCVAAGVAYFHKQDSGPRSGQNVELDGVVWHQFPAVPA